MNQERRYASRLSAAGARGLVLTAAVATALAAFALASHQVFPAAVCLVVLVVIAVGALTERLWTCTRVGPDGIHTCLSLSKWEARWEEIAGIEVYGDPRIQKVKMVLVGGQSIRLHGLCGGSLYGNPDFTSQVLDLHDLLVASRTGDGRTAS